MTKQILKQKLALFSFLTAALFTLSAFTVKDTGRAAPQKTESTESEGAESEKTPEELPPAPTDAARIAAGLEPVAAAQGPWAADAESEENETAESEDAEPETMEQETKQETAEPEPAAPENAKSVKTLSATEILAGTRIIAHGMGSTDGVSEGSAPLNCLETFLAQYAAGVRVFEADLRLTRDGQVVLRHDWWPSNWQEGIDWTAIPTREEFISKPILGKYTPLSFRDLLILMAQYTDVCIITDTKFTDSDVIYIEFGAMLADAAELGLTELFDRMVIQLYDGNMRQCLEKIYPFPHRIYTLYVRGFKQTQADFREIAKYCAEHGVEGITMWDYWWNANYTSIAQEYGIKVYVHTVNDAAAARKLLGSGVNGVYTDVLAPKDLI